MIFYVATNGRDDWSGRQADPAQDGTDGPFATLEGARDAIRLLKDNGDRDGIEVRLREGTYSLGHPFELSERDSGTRDRPIVFRPHNQESVTLSGGHALSDFEPVDDEKIRGRLPEHAREHVVQADLVQAGVNDLGEVDQVGKRTELFYDSRPMTLARYPNDGFMTISDVSGREPFTVHGIDGDRRGVFTCNDPRLRAWSQETDIRLHGYWFWDWSDAFQKVIRIDDTRGEIELSEPYHNYGYRPGQRFYALNMLCELDQPGEWFLDRDRAMLYFWPPGNDAEASSVLSVLSSLITFTNTSWVTVKGLTLEICRGTALEVEGGEGVRISNCCIRNTGSWGVTIEGGMRHSVDGSDISNTGEGGLKLSGGDRVSLTAAGHEACTNHVHDFGRLYRTYRPAFSVEGVGNRVAHNKIHEGPHNAIQLKGNDHVIEFNEIFNVCFETGDVGAFYMGRDWTEQGVIIRYNHFHDVTGPGLHGAMGVYLDDAASGVTIFGNIFQRVSRAAFVGGGRHNTIENNIFIECEPAVHIDARGLGWMRSHVVPGGIMPERLEHMPYKSPPWSERYPELVELNSGDPGEPIGNTVRRNISQQGTWTDIEEIAVALVDFSDNKVDQHIALLDDFISEPKPGSPELPKGFLRIPYGQIGLYDGDQRLKQLDSPIDDSWYEHLDVPDRIVCGGVVCRMERDQVMVALVKESKYPFFVLPKGGVEAGESYEQAAVREIQEESGLQEVTLIEGLGRLERLAYNKRVWSVVHMFLFTTGEVTGTPTDKEHHYGVWWFPIDALPAMFWPEQARFLISQRAHIEETVRRASTH